MSIFNNKAWSKKILTLAMIVGTISYISIPRKQETIHIPELQLIPLAPITSPVERLPRVEPEVRISPFVGPSIEPSAETLENPLFEAPPIHSEQYSQPYSEPKNENYQGPGYDLYNGLNNLVKEPMNFFDLGLPTWYPLKHKTPKLSPRTRDDIYTGWTSRKYNTPDLHIGIVREPREHKMHIEVVDKYGNPKQIPLETHKVPSARITGVRPLHPEEPKLLQPGYDRKAEPLLLPSTLPRMRFPGYRR